MADREHAEVSASAIPVGELGTVAPIAGRAVAPELAADRAAVAAVAAEDPGDRCAGRAL